VELVEKHYEIGLLWHQNGKLFQTNVCRLLNAMEVSVQKYFLNCHKRSSKVLNIFFKITINK